MAIGGVFFDLGGTLFEYDHSSQQTGRLLVETIASLPGAAGLQPQQIGKAYGKASQEIARQYAQLDFYLHADLFRDTFMHAVDALKLTFDEQIYARFSRGQHSAIVDHLRLKDDCIDTLSALKERGLYLSIVSNIDEDMLQPLVQREGLHDWLDHWTSSEAAQSCKPHAGVFDVSLEKSGLAPEQVMFVGDSPEHDVNGAAPFGMRTVLVKNGDRAAPLQSGATTSDPHHTIRDLAELLTLV